MRRKRVSQETSRAKASKRSSAAGSRSMHTSVPVGPIRPAASRGTCVRVMSRRMAKALSDSGDFRVQGLLVLVPAVAIPELQVIEVPADHDVLLDPGVLEQGLVEGDPAGRVELDVERAAREEAGELAALGADGVQVRQEA